MAGPSSIVNLLARAASLTKAILSYAAAVKDAPKELEKLRQSLASLVDVAKQLVDLIEDEDVKKDFGDVSSLYNAIGDFVVTLDILQKRLDKRAVKGIHKALDRLKWPFEASETQNLIDTLQTYVQVFQYGLTFQAIRVLSQTSQKASEILKTSKQLSQTQIAIINAIPALPEHKEIMDELRELRIGTDFVQTRTQEAIDHAFLEKLSNLDFHNKQKDAYGNDTLTRVNGCSGLTSLYSGPKVRLARFSGALAIPAPARQSLPQLPSTPLPKSFEGRGWQSSMSTVTTRIV